MDNRAQEELQFLSSGGVFLQSFKLIFKWKKIFSQIVLALIIPLFLIVIARTHISQVFIDRYDINTTGQAVGKIYLYAFFELAYLTFIIIFSLLSTSAVVYTIACIYAARQVTFKTVMRVVPKVWMRLSITFIVGYAILFLYSLVGIVLLSLVIGFLRNSVITIVLAILFVVWFVYIYMIWNLASVVSVLEESKGCKAMKKSKFLIKGHLWVSIALFVFQAFAFWGISFGYEVVMFSNLNLGIKILVGILCFLLMVILFLVVLVIQTVIYFVCKSYHNENINRTLLGDHLEASYGGYVRLNEAKEVQLEQPIQAV
jgi:hypothetical protein